jgi:hypothetical protein
MPWGNQGQGVFSLDGAGAFTYPEEKSRASCESPLPFFPAADRQDRRAERGARCVTPFLRKSIAAAASSCGDAISSPLT